VSAEASLGGQFRENAHDALARKREIHFNADRLSGEVVDDRQRPKLPPVGQDVVHEVQ